jgi:hypothetical protein
MADNAQSPSANLSASAHPIILGKMDQNRRDYGDLDQSQRRPVRWERWRRRMHLRPFVVPAIVLLVLVTFAAGYFVGAVSESQRQYRAKYERDRAAIVPVLAADPAFSKVAISPYGGGGLLLEGSVVTPADAARLRDEFVRLFGETEVRRIAVQVSQTGQWVSDM